jgi:hypothetical protein
LDVLLEFNIGVVVAAIGFYLILEGFIQLIDPILHLITSLNVFIKLAFHSLDVFLVIL